MNIAIIDRSLRHFSESPLGIHKLRGVVLDLATNGEIGAKTDVACWHQLRLGEVMLEGLQSIMPAETPDTLFELWSVPAYEHREPEIVFGAQIGSSKREIPDGSVLLSKINPHLNRVWQVKRRSANRLIASPEWIVINADEQWDARYLAYLLMAPRINQALCATAQGMGSLTRASAKRASDIGLLRPPLAEQKRIVAKVDELMALCDRLEAQLEERDARSADLSKAALAKFSEEPTVENLEYLFHPSFSVSAEDVRACILMLAMQGRLEQQIQSDEPVAIALARNDENRRQRSLSDRRADEQSQALLSGEDRWSIPSTWAWRGLADLVLFVDYRGKTPTKQAQGVRLLTAKNVRRANVNLSPEEFISDSDYGKWMTRGFPQPGDVLFTTEAPMGNAAVVKLTERFALAQRVICLQSYGAIDTAFLVLQIISEQFQLILDRNATGVTAKGIKGSKLKQLPIAVPPLAEQRRIVAKVEELMALVDQLEAQLAASEEVGTKLLDALVAELAPSNWPCRSSRRSQLPSCPKQVPKPSRSCLKKGCRTPL